MASQSTVQQLSEAENLAQQLIKDAQEGRKKVVQKAKDSGKHELEILRRRREQEFQTQIKPKFQNTEEIDKLAQQTEQEVSTIYNAYNKSSQTAVDLLVQRVIDINIEIPKVVKGMHELQKQYAKK
ncbi:hypothetical protein PPERSA_08810 [Pseudocohnilembus persalinus]|uniref:V-type proton ATPase subunit G n=1 Tax=Pseudocohnilembus persalinus TaxID=266149 RepID=A0A0V0R3K3_PSEPJ|nr:hypothetical protein PPERSA_08810 [Pseudocohnilembus persalinus]|eukprot:KRX09094.1 hypothetical protein PPERSA_08810 [Pseudocohnilembus persalinus]